jgi:hydrogenase-4 component E
MSPATVIDVCAAGIVLLGVLMAVTLSIGRSIWLLAAQGALVGAMAIGVGLGQDAEHLVIAGGMTVAAKGIAVPAILMLMLRASPVRVERHPYVGRRLSLAIAIAIVFVSSVVVADITLSWSPGGERALPAALAEVLTGLFLVMTRRKAISLLIGLLVFENGLAMVAFVLTPGMPLVVELGILLDVLIAVVVGWVYTRRMLAVLGTTSTDHLRSLRG